MQCTILVIDQKYSIVAQIYGTGSELQAPVDWNAYIGFFDNSHKLGHLLSHIRFMEVFSRFSACRQGD